MGAEPLRVIEGGGPPHGWEALWAKDVWRLSELPHGDLASAYDGEVFIHFERLRQPWLKEAAKRWARARLLGETTPQTMSRYLTDLWHFSDWLAAYAPEAVAPALLSRAVLEDYLLWVRRESDWKPATRNHRLVALRALLEEQAEDGLAGLPRGAVIHRAELPRVDYRLPKQLPGEVFAQWVDPANLALLDDEQHRTVVLLLAFTGFRVSSVVTLARDALEFGPDGHPYLRYFNVKAGRQAMLPIAPALSEQLDRQEAMLAGRYPEGTEWLLPSPPRGQRNGKGGAFHVSPRTTNAIVKGYVNSAGIHAVDGPLAEAAWMKERIARAKQALPNGYCGLPLVQSCPHPNACLSCESFLTDGSFRGVHQEQQTETRRLLANARENNNVRLIEVLERDEHSLTRILEGLNAIEAHHAECDGDRLDLRDLAACGEAQGA